MNKKEFLVLLVMTCVVIIIWVISDIYHTQANIKVLPTLQQALEPLDPNLDQTTLDQIKKLNNPPVVMPQTPTPTIKTSPSPTSTTIPQIATPSAAVEQL